MSDEEREQIETEIRNYKQLLSQTDYEAIKYAEGAISDADYEEYKTERKGWRTKINELEKQLGE